LLKSEAGELKIDSWALAKGVLTKNKAVRVNQKATTNFFITNILKTR
jgi:hypothetical protein